MEIFHLFSGRSPPKVSEVAVPFSMLLGGLIPERHETLLYFPFIVLFAVGLLLILIDDAVYTDARLPAASSTEICHYIFLIDYYQKSIWAH